MRITPLACLSAFAIVCPISARAQSKPIPASEVEISITFPREWKYRDTVAVNQQQPLRIVALVRHPSGIQRILINNKSVQFGRDPENTTFWRFDTTLTAGTVTDVVAITVYPVRGDSLKRLYYTTSKLSGPDSPRGSPSAKSADSIPRNVEKKDPEPAKPAAVIPACSYASYKKRGIGYGVAGGVGIVIGASGQKAGFGLAAIAAVAAGIDGFVTMNRAECKSR